MKKIIIGMVALLSFSESSKVLAVPENTKEYVPAYWVVKEKPIEKAHWKPKNKINSKDLTCLAKNIYHEARGSTYKDQLGVALVTMNRVKSKEYGKSVCDVVWSKAQFSWTLDKKLWKITDKKSYEKAVKIAKRVLTKTEKDITMGATHYYNPNAADPFWADYGYNKKKIGSHIYMKVYDVD